MTDGARGCKGAQGQLFVFISLWCHSRGGETTVPCKMYLKGVGYVYTPPQLLAYHAHYIIRYRNYIQIGPHSCCGPAKA
jgi:hypothetical protein